MNLVQTAALVRKLVLLFIAFVVMYILFLLMKPGLRGIYYAVFPPKDLPTPLYGLLPPLEFVEKAPANTNYTFELNTTDGRLPRGFPKNMPVYKIAKVPFSYEAGKNAQEHAELLGYMPDELVTDLKGEIYRWRDKETGGNLEININTQEIIAAIPVSGKASQLERGILNVTNSIELARRLLTEIGRLTDARYQSASTVVTLGRIINTDVVATDTPFDAELARVDFFRKIADYPIVNTDPHKGNVSVTVAQPTRGVAQTLVALETPFIDYHAWEIEIPANTAETATYPIITAQQAWNAISEESKGVTVSLIPNGGSVFTSHTPTRIDQVLINNIYLAYYDTTERQDYLQPIYVFEGSYNVGGRAGGEIVLYFPAIDGTYIDAGTETADENL